MDEVIKKDRRLAYLKFSGLVFALISISLQTENFDYIDTFSVALTEISLLIFLTISDHSLNHWRECCNKSSVNCVMQALQIKGQQTLIYKLELKIYKLEKRENNI